MIKGLIKAVADVARADAQSAVEELRGLRAAEESALTALADEELAARFNGDVTLTVRDDAVTVLSPEQVTLSRQGLGWKLVSPQCGCFKHLLQPLQCCSVLFPPYTLPESLLLQTQAIFEVISPCRMWCVTSARRFGHLYLRVGKYCMGVHFGH